ncbi:MAG: histone family protein [Methanobacterium sp.]
MTELPLAPLKRIIKNAGAQRVSPEAEEVLAKILEDLAEEISEGAVKCAKHAGRVTVQASDIEMSCK